jgi:hypothetical protein
MPSGISFGLKVVDEAVAVVVDAVRDLVRVDPQVVAQVVVVEVDAAVQNRDHDRVALRGDAAGLDVPSAFGIDLEQAPLGDAVLVGAGVTRGLGARVVVEDVERIQRHLLVALQYHVRRRPHHVGQRLERGGGGSRIGHLRGDDGAGVRRQRHGDPSGPVHAPEAPQPLCAGLRQEPVLVGARLELDEDVGAGDPWRDGLGWTDRGGGRWSRGAARRHVGRGALRDGGERPSNQKEERRKASGAPVAVVRGHVGSPCATGALRAALCCTRGAVLRHGSSIRASFSHPQARRVKGLRRKFRRSMNAHRFLGAK